MHGQLLVALGETLLAGGDLLVDLDHQRADRAGRLPSSRWTRITAATMGQTAISAFTGRSSGTPRRNPRRSTTGPISQNGSDRAKTSRQYRSGDRFRPAPACVRPRGRQATSKSSSRTRTSG
jgi:hypothetical protein